MVSEIERLHKENIALDAVVPHFKIAYVTKKKDKKRTVPIVLALEMVREHLSNTVAWVGGLIESTPGAALKKIMMVKAYEVLEFVSVPKVTGG